jgi:hypothetical protein
MNARAGGAQRALARPVAVASLLIFLCLAAASGAGSAAASGVAVAPWTARQAGAFWTPERMRQAEPVELAGAGGRGSPSATADFEQVQDPAGEQFRQNGVIFFYVGIFGIGRCSGTAVDAGNKSVVFTAGHCVNSGGRRGQWYRSRWVFVPGYRYGQRPFGVFAAKWIDTTKRWRSTGSENFDVGAAVVGRNERGELLTDAVGGAGIAWGLKPKQTFDVHGYPVERPFDGETQRICEGRPFLGHDLESFLYPGPLNMAVSCDVTGGASGGGWTIHGDTLNSVTNYGYPDDPTTDFGAYFGKEVARLYGRAARVR